MFSLINELFFFTFLYSLLSDNYQDLNNVATRIEQQETIQTSSTQSLDTSNTTDEDDVT